MGEWPSWAFRGKGRERWRAKLWYGKVISFTFFLYIGFRIKKKVSVGSQAGNGRVTELVFIGNGMVRRGEE